MSKLSNPSQLLARNIELFSDKRVLVAGFNDDSLIELLASSGAAQVMGYGLDYHNHVVAQKSLTRSNATLQFAAYYDNKAHQPWQQLVIYWPKAKQRVLYLLANLLPHLAPDAEIYLVGDNKGGVKSCGKLLADYCDETLKLDAARHCSLYRAMYRNNAVPFEKEQWLKQYKISVADSDINIRSLPGVFSHGELDLGTQLLLENIGHVKMKRTLDFGCGCGVIGTFIGIKRQGIPIELVDIDALAIESAKLTLAANGVTGKVYASDGFSDISGKFATIVSNPPFHSGIKTDYRVPEQFIATAPQQLMDGGQLRIVANKFLKYEPIIEQHFAKQELVAETTKFKILAAKT